MEFNQKLQALRQQRGLTQEELAADLYVSRTAVSKWESGRGYPSIDSLKAISKYFSVSVDELLSGRELMAVAEKDREARTSKNRDLVFGLLDCLSAIAFFFPLFGQQAGEMIQIVSLYSFVCDVPYIKTAYTVLIIVTVLWGILTLALQSCDIPVWIKWKHAGSLMLSACGTLLFIASRQPYAAAFVFALLLIKGIILIKRA